MFIPINDNDLLTLHLRWRVTVVNGRVMHWNRRLWLYWGLEQDLDW